MGKRNTPEEERCTHPVTLRKKEGRKEGRKEGNCGTETVLVTDGRKYFPRGPQVDQSWYKLYYIDMNKYNYIT